MDSRHRLTSSNRDPGFDDPLGDRPLAGSPEADGHAEARLDRPVPRAVWRLMQIAERAGLSGPVHRALLLETFAGPRGLPQGVAAALAAFELNDTELFLIVALFSADPHPLSLMILGREALAEPEAIEAALGHLEAQGVVLRSRNRCQAGDTQVWLTDLGRDMTVYAIYRIVTAAKSR